MDKQKQIQHIPPAAFNFMTNYYDTITEMFGFGKKLKRRVLEMLEAKDGETILDVGSGTGTFLAIASKALPHSKLIGVDPDRKALAIAREKLAGVESRVTLYEASAEELPVADKSIDICVSTLAFHHLPRLVKLKAIQEIHRVLKPDGKFILVDFGKPVSFLSRILLFVGGFIDGRDNLQANLEGVLPIYLQQVGFSVSEIAKPYRGIHFLMANK
ncbi:MAG: methyltransferase domain-containing protein [bacterium]|nr:methyltransferase domain-containing protein [bacterium]